MEYLDLIRNTLYGYEKEIFYLSMLIMGLGSFQNLIYFIQIPIALIEIIHKKLQSTEENKWWLLTSDITIPVSILIPAFNEELTIVDTVTSTLATQYPSFEVIVVNDDSKDRSLAKLIEAFSLVKTNLFFEEKLKHKKIRGIYTSPIYKNLVIVDKENGGRSDALNAAIDVARNPIFCTLDADSKLDPSALIKATQPFIEHPKRMIATGGTVRIINGCRVEHGIVKQVKLPSKFLTLFQIIEYIRAFLIGRLAWSHLGIVTIISGAFTVLKRETVIEVGGFNTKTIGEDYELIMRIHEHCLNKKERYEMHFIAEPVCWTEVPENLKTLANQRIRWQQGALEVFFRHLNMLMNPKYGKIGFLAYPLILITDVIGPIAELLGYILFPIFYILGVLNTEFMITFLCLFFALGISLSTIALVLEEFALKHFSKPQYLFKLWIAAIIENFGYRQINNIWRIIGWWRFLIKKQQWGNMERVGVNKS